MNSKGKEEKKVKLEIYAKHLIKKLAQSVSDKDKEFTGIPLQCRMLAEAFDREVETFCKSAESVPELRFSRDLLGLYERFLNRKYDICCEEKFNMSMTNVGTKAVRKQYVEDIIQNHHLLALKTLFVEEQLAVLQINSQRTSSEEDLIRTGLVQASHDGKLHFIHRTFAEYYVAEFLVNQLAKWSNTPQKLQVLLLQRIFVEISYQVVRTFIDGLLSKSQPSKDVLKQYGNRISDLRRDRVPILHQAAREGDAHIIGFILDSVKTGEHTDTLNELLLHKDYSACTAWQLAAVGGNIKVLEKLWECAKEKLTTEELNNKMLLAKDNKQWTAWHYASSQGNVEALQKLWECGKGTLTAEELNNKLLLAKDSMGRTAWHLATAVDNTKVLDKLRECAKQQLPSKELNDNFFLAKDIIGKTAWHLAVEKGKLDALQEMWEWGKETLTAEELNNKLLLAKDDWGQSAWHLAAWCGNLQALQKLWEWGKETLAAEDLKNKLLLDKDTGELTAWRLAAMKGKLEITQKLWDWGKENLTAEELNNKLLLAKDSEGQTAWHVAAEDGKLEVLQELWAWAKETLTAEELKNKLLLAKDNMGETAWHVAAKKANTAVLQKLYEWAKQAEINLKGELFLAKNNRGKTALELLSENGYVTESERLKGVELIKKCL
jgi:ankyrin repeat protein